MICPRCDSKDISILANSPIGDEWKMYICGDCNFSWRSSETEEITDASKYDKRFKLSKENIQDMMVYPPIPDLR